VYVPGWTGAGADDGSGDKAEELDKRITATIERDLKIAEWLETSSDPKTGTTICPKQESKVD
jgi:hypothetical protein